MEGEGRDGNGNFTSPVDNQNCECSKTKSDGMVLESVLLQVKNDSSESVLQVQSLEGDDDEKICRIRHLGNWEMMSSSTSSEDQLIRLGCGCKGELGVSHLPCAQTWFKLKGNRLCEICGKTATNVSGGVEDINSVILLVEWDEMRLMSAAASAAARGGGGVDSSNSDDQCKRTFRNIVMACLVLAFVVPCFFRINMS